MSKIAPKIINDIVNKVYSEDEPISLTLPHFLSNKTYLYSICSALSGIIILFTIGLNQMSPQFIEQLSMILDRIGFLNLNLSYKFIEDLKFPNPISLLILVSNSAFILYALSDSIRSKDKPSKSHFKESYAVSYAIHLLFLLVLFVSIFLAYRPRPKIKVNTLEFITVQEPTKEKPPPKTKKRSERASIDQGKNDPKKKTKPVKKNPSKLSKPKQKARPKAPSTAPLKPSPKPKPRIKGKTEASQNIPNKAPNKAPKARTPSKTANAVPKTISKDTSSKSVEKALAQIPAPTVPASSSNFSPNISRASSYSRGSTTENGLPAPKNYGYSRGSGAGTGGGSRTGEAGTAAPKAAEEISGGGPSGQDLVDRLGTIQIPDNIDVSFGEGAGFSNPAENKYPGRAPSTASIPDISFGPYMSKIQEKIKQRWRPPKGSESKRIVAVFSINRDGSLSNLKISKTNANSLANDAALNAIRNSAPFPALPLGSPQSIDIEFTFDYNVFKRSRY